jgi:hypothetical protein
MPQGLKKWLLRIGGLLLIAFVFFQIVRKNSNPVKTETVFKTTVVDYAKASAVAIRSESLVCSDNSGVAVYVTENGEKVAKGNPLIEYYDNQADVSKKKRIDELKSQIKTLKELDEQNSYTVGDLDLVSAQISAGIYEVLNASEAPGSSDFNIASDNLLRAMNQGQIVTGREKDFKEVIKNLEAKLNKLESSYSGKLSTFNSEESGYFVNIADGYESAYPYDKILDITAGDVANLTETELPKNCVGKLINSDEWYFVATLNSKDSRNVIKDTSVTVRIPNSDVGEIKMYVEKITDNNDGTATAVLSCSYMSSELSTLRFQDIQIVVGRYTGLRVNKDSVRVVDGKVGVYVRLGKLVKFREINIIYSGKDFVICESSQAPGELKIYDEAVIKGKELEHGKLLY